MYAVVSTGGKQYKVQKDEILRVEKLPGTVGDRVSFDKVLLFNDGETVTIGQPTVEGIAVGGHIVQQGKAKKIVVFKYKRRKRYRRKQGHRQPFTAVKIDWMGTGEPEEAIEAKDELVQKEEVAETAPVAEEAAGAATVEAESAAEEAVEAAPAEEETSTDEPVEDKKES